MKPPLIAYREQITTFVAEAFKHAEHKGFVSLRVFKGRQKAKAIVAVKFNGTTELIDKATAMATEWANAGEGYVFCPPICTFKNQKKAAQTDIAEGLLLTVDVDERPLQSQKILEEQLGPATIVDASGGFWRNPQTGEDEAKVHLHWRLTVPTRDAAGHALLKEARTNAILLIKGDMTAAPVNHPFRWPGSWHTKDLSQARLCSIISVTNNEIVLKDAAAKLRALVPEVAVVSEYNEELARADIVAGAHYQQPTLYLLGKWARAAVPLATAIADLRALFDSTPEDKRRLRGGDWRSSYDDIKRQAKGIYAKEAAKPKAVHLHPKSPLATARKFVGRSGALRLRHHMGTFYEWVGTHYVEVSDDDIAASLYEFMEKAERTYTGGSGKNKTTKTGPFNPMRQDIENVLHALRSHVHLPDRLAPPTWLDARASSEPLIACANGLLRLSDGVLLRHSPDYFNTSATDFDFDPNAPAPTEFIKFLDSVWKDDQESIDSLQDIFGYALSGDRRQQKIIALIGPKRSGKGTIGRVLTRLVGGVGVAGPTLSSFGKDFGLEPLINKMLAIIPDARIRGGGHEVVERLLAISGGDKLNVARKHRGDWSAVLPTLLLFLTNEVPSFADNSGALASRFIILQLVNSFFGREDLTLGAKLANEMPGILNWTVAGWQRLNARGHLIQPASGMATVEILDTLASPIKAFLRDRCEVGPTFEIDTNDLYAAWRAWCAEQGRDHSGNKATFGRSLFAAETAIKTVQPREGNERKRVYRGLRLRGEIILINEDAAATHDSAAEAADDGPPAWTDRWGGGEPPDEAY